MTLVKAMKYINGRILINSGVLECMRSLSNGSQMAISEPFGNLCLVFVNESTDCIDTIA